MNCREPPEPECRCCDECIELQNERFRRSNYQTSSTSQNRRNDPCCEGPGYAVHIEKRSGGRQKSSSYCQKDYDQKQWVDANTLRTLSSLRERACKFLETSVTTRTADEDECRPYIRVKESYPCDGLTRKKAQDINYEPQSNFLRKMKRKCHMKGESDTYQPAACMCDGYSQERAYEPEFQYSNCMRSADDCSPKTVQPSRHYISERATQYSDVSSIHDPCTCYRTWRPKSAEDECTDDVDLMKEYNDLCRDLSDFQETLEARNGLCDGYEDEEEEENAPGDEEGKCRHVSRSDAAPRKKSRRAGAPTGKPGQTSENDFEPSLKKPLPDSCDRCWRYASPSRSPVNKPSQRFDPNYRRSHSDLYVNAEGRAKEGRSSGSRGSKTNESCDERETKVHQLMTSSGGTLPQTGGTKSTDDIKRRRGSKSLLTDKSSLKNQEYGDRIAPKSGKEGDSSRGSYGTGVITSGITGGGGRVGGHRSQSGTDDATMAKSQSRGDGRNLSVNFEDRARRKADPIQSSPSMFDKSGQKAGKKPGAGGRPSTGEIDGSSTKLRKGAKSKTAVGSQKSKSKTAQSVDRDGRSPCSNERVIGMSPCLKHSTSKPISQLDTQHRPDCPNKQKTTSDSARGSTLQKRPDSTGSSSCLCKNTNYQRERYGSEGCRRHVLEGTTRREITSSAHRCGNCQFCRKNSPSRSSRDGGSVCPSGSTEGRKCGCRNHRSPSNNPSGNRSESSERQNNPRKYCVFYMNKTKLNRAHDVEVLIEELTQGKNRKDSGEEALREKMKRMKDVREDSMALRFQKGVAESHHRPKTKTNRVLYF